MHTLGGIVFALVVIAITSCIIVGSTSAVVQKLEGHIEARPQDGEAPGRYFGGHADAARGNLVRFHRQVSSRLLSSGSEGLG